jgi:hypothetical protein
MRQYFWALAVLGSRESSDGQRGKMQRWPPRSFAPWRGVSLLANVPQRQVRTRQLPWTAPPHVARVPQMLAASTWFTPLQTLSITWRSLIT